MVPGRSAHWPEKQDRKALGQTRDAAIGTEGSADEIGLYLWRDLPGVSDILCKHEAGSLIAVSAS
jgi:hypothetical protein